MRKITRLGSALALGASLTIAGACGGGDDAGTNQASDSAAAATGALGGTTGDSAAGMTGGAGTTGAAGAMSAPNVLSMVGLSNAAEIQTSQIALEKATNAQVKEYAQTMVNEHQAMQKEADQLATSANITPQPPEQATQKQQMLDQMVQQLNSTAKGAAFDRAYIDGQVQAHQQTLQELQQFQTAVDNAELRGLIERAIPKVQQHLQRAQQLQSSLPQS